MTSIFYPLKNKSSETSGIGNIYYVWNNIIRTAGTSTYAAYFYYGTTYLFNNTGVNANSSNSVFFIDSVVVYAKNNLAFNNSTGSGFSGSGWNAASTSNASNKGDAPGSNPVDISAYAPTGAFFNWGITDLHLNMSAALLIGAGADLSGDANLSFDEDIDGDTRTPGSWDIGADQYTP